MSANCGRAMCSSSWKARPPRPAPVLSASLYENLRPRYAGAPLLRRPRGSSGALAAGALAAALPGVCTVLRRTDSWWSEPPQPATAKSGTTRSSDFRTRPPRPRSAAGSGDGCRGARRYPARVVELGAPGFRLGARLIAPAKCRSPLASRDEGSVVYRPRVVDERLLAQLPVSGVAAGQSSRVAGFPPAVRSVSSAV